MSRAEVEEFFEAYRENFNRLDGDAVADTWHTQSAITHRAKDAEHADVTMWTSDAPMRENMRALCDVYRNAGYANASYSIDEFVPLGQHHAFVLLSWTIQRSDGSTLQSFRTGYNLMRGKDGPRVILATAFEEDIGKMRDDATH
jgi:hypothetical protein